MLSKSKGNIRYAIPLADMEVIIQLVKTIKPKLD